jgi:hypothetical protein
VVNPASHPQIVTKNVGTKPGPIAKSSIHSMIAGQTERATGARQGYGMRQECGRPRHETGNSRRSTGPMIYRARRMPRLEIRPLGKDPTGRRAKQGLASSGRPFPRSTEASPGCFSGR